MVDGSGGGDERPSQPAGHCGDSTECVGTDTVFELLAHVYRREICRALQDRSEWALTELARRVAARRADVPVAAVEADTVENVQLALYHTHLPKLQKHGVVRFENESESVCPATNIEPVVAALEAVAATTARE